jgi:predicted glutamine amidotransferase
MCIICVSNKGVKQPTKSQLQQMYLSNPHGAGYMFARAGFVQIRKGFMTFSDFYAAVKTEKFTSNDVVIYHFRISTQAGVTPEMCHPFPLTTNITQCKKLDTLCSIGVAHNGIIALTSDSHDTEYNDTAHFIAEYMSRIIQSSDDLQNPQKLKRIEMLSHSKFAILDSCGNVKTIGNFIEENGLLFSNFSYLPPLVKLNHYNYFTTTNVKNQTR